MARYGRLGPMIKDSPEFEDKYGPRDPRDASSYESRSTGGIDVTQYESVKGIDLDKSRQLAQYRKEYGAAMDNKILENYMKLYAPTSGKYMPDPEWTIKGPGSMWRAAQDQFLGEIGLMGGKGVRGNHQRAKNPMIYGK